MSTVAAKHLRDIALRPLSGISRVYSLLQHIALFLADNATLKIELRATGGSGGEMAEWLIWSREHQGWWRAGHAGYTRATDEAGLYTLTEARAIMEKANILLARAHDCGGLPEESIIHAAAVGRRP